MIFFSMCFSLEDMGLAEELLLAMWSGMASGATVEAKLRG